MTGEDPVTVAPAPPGGRARRRPAAIVLLAGLAVALAALFWTGAALQGRYVNTDLSRVDQDAYLNYARRMRESGYTAAGDRNRMPVYPFLQSLIHRADLTPAERFGRGKLLNTALAILLLALLVPAFRTWLPPLQAATLALIAAFTVFVYRAPYVQAELLYYVLSFLSFLLFVELILRPRPAIAILAGAAAGFAQLTKAALLPGLALFLCVMLALSAWRLIRWRESRGLVALALVVASFLIVVYPYISTSKKMFGRWFYNVNTTFYMWYDTHEEVMTGTRVHGDRVGWPTLPSEQIPTMRRYFQEHTPSQILSRITGGCARIHRAAMRSYGYYKFVLLYAGCALLALLLGEFGAIAAASSGPEAPRPGPRDRSLAAAVFVFCWIGGYLILVAWVSATNPGVTRLSLQVFLPLMAILAYLATRGDGVAPRLGLAGRRVTLSQVFCGIALGLLGVDVWFSLSHRLATMFAGD